MLQRFFQYREAAQMHKPTCLINNHVFPQKYFNRDNYTSWPDLVPGQLMTILNRSTNQRRASPNIRQSEARIHPRDVH